MTTLAAPVRVSPVIKFFRWSLLGSGVVWGAFHQSRLSRKEAKLRVVEAKKQAALAEKHAAEKKYAIEKELKELREQYNLTI